MMVWISFCDPHAPIGEQFQGVAIVRSSGFASAVFDAHRLGCNPGGEAAGYEIGDPPVPEEYVNRLLNKEEIAALEVIMGGE